MRARAIQYAARMTPAQCRAMDEDEQFVGEWMRRSSAEVVESVLRDALLHTFPASTVEDMTQALNREAHMAARGQQ